MFANPKGTVRTLRITVRARKSGLGAQMTVGVFGARMWPDMLGRERDWQDAVDAR